MLDLARLRLISLTALALAACGPGSFASEGESGASGESGSSESEGLPPPPPPAQDCLERGGTPTLVDAGKPLLEDFPDSLTPEDIVATDDTLLAFWRIGFNGSNPIPNVFTGILDHERELLGPPYTLREEPATAGPRVRRDQDGLSLSLCARWGAVDRAATMRLALDGTTLVEPIRRAPEDRNCGISGHVPDAVWIGNGRYLSAHRDNSSGPVPGYELLVDLFDSSGSSLGWLQIQDDGNWEPEPRFVVSTQAVFLVSQQDGEEGQSEDSVVLHRFEPDGTWLPEEQLTLELPPGVPPGEIALAADSEGIVLWMEAQPLPYRWKLDPLGQPLAGPTQLPLEIGGEYSDFEIEPRPGGFALVATHANWESDESSIFVAWLGETGLPLWSTEITPPIVAGASNYAWRPSLTQHEDSTFVLWEAVHLDGPAGDANALFVSEIACVE